MNRHFYLLSYDLNFFFCIVLYELISHLEFSLHITVNLSIAGQSVDVSRVEGDWAEIRLWVPKSAMKEMSPSHGGGIGFRAGKPRLQNEAPPPSLPSSDVSNLLRTVRKNIHTTASVFPVPFSFFFS